MKKYMTVKVSQEVCNLCGNEITSFQMPYQRAGFDTELCESYTKYKTKEEYLKWLRK